MSIALGHTDRRSAVADPLPEGLEPGPARSAAGCTLGRSTPRTSNREPMIQNTPTFRRHPNTFGNRPHVQQQHPAVRQCPPTSPTHLLSANRFTAQLPGVRRRILHASSDGLDLWKSAPRASSGVWRSTAPSGAPSSCWPIRPATGCSWPECSGPATPWGWAPGDFVWSATPGCADAADAVLTDERAQAMY